MEPDVDQVLRSKFARLLGLERIEELSTACGLPRSTVRRRVAVARTGNAELLLVIEGWAARWRSFPDGSRQIVAFLLPGDFGGLDLVDPIGTDQGLTAVTDCVVALVDRDRLGLLWERRPVVAAAFHRLALADLAIARTWIANVGRRSALERIAHLLCELCERMAPLGRGEGRPPPIPLTQDDMADATGITPVHVNRMVAELRSRGLVENRVGSVTVVDVPGLRRLASFDAAYLHVAAAAGGAAE